MLVQEVGYLLVLKRFALHDVAPVTSRIANAQEKRFLLLPGLGERLRAPRVPVHRIMLMLQQVRGFLTREPIGVSSGMRIG